LDRSDLPSEYIDEYGRRFRQMGDGVLHHRNDDGQWIREVRLRYDPAQTDSD